MISVERRVGKFSTIVMAQRECYQNGQTSLELRYYITSLESNAKKIAKAVRGHWGIENSFIGS